MQLLFGFKLFLPIIGGVPGDSEFVCVRVLLV